MNLEVSLLVVIQPIPAKNKKMLAVSSYKTASEDYHNYARGLLRWVAGSFSANSVYSNIFTNETGRRIAPHST